jgi:hypothetical protein
MSSQFASVNLTLLGPVPNGTPARTPETNRQHRAQQHQQRLNGPSGQSKLQSIKPSNSFSSSRSKPPWLTVTVLPILTRGILRRTQGIMMFVAGKEESWVMQKDESHY